jgi:hypothetical protein
VTVHAEYVFPALNARGQEAELLDRYRFLHHEFPGLVLGARALAAIARAADKLNQPAVAISATQLLLRDHPKNPATPGMVWMMAGLQERAGRPDLVKKTLQILIQHYPADPMADRARARLTASG